ncbi:MAG: 2-hydroxychromene-2-carboxylate isomerase [Devosiaceae bacterium]
MAATIDYYFTLISPFSYMGHTVLLDIAEKHSASIRYKPMNLFDVFKTSGAVPVPERPASRQAYRFIELQRIAHYRDVPLTLKPKHWPTNPALSNGAVEAIVQAGGDPASYMLAAFQACWANEQDIADENVVRALLSSTGHDADSILATAKSDAVEAAMANYTQQAIDAGIVGAPGYALNGEPYWGQDRLEYLDHALSSGRGAFVAS